MSNDSEGDGKPGIISVLVENCRRQMPPLLKALLYIDFTPGYDGAFRELLQRGFGLESRYSN
jgi:hypothetical protein